MSRIAGTAYLKHNGEQLALKGSFTVSPSAVEREGIAGLDFVHGFRESPRVPFIEGTISLVPELSLETLERITDETVTAELANGKAYLLTHAWCRAALEANAGDGEVTVRFEGLTCREIT